MKNKNFKQSLKITNSIPLTKRRKLSFDFQGNSIPLTTRKFSLSSQETIIKNNLNEKSTTSEILIDDKIKIKKSEIKINEIKILDVDVEENINNEIKHEEMKIIEIASENKNVKNLIDPFDMIVFKGTSFISKIISYIQKIFFKSGEWTHVGIILTKDILDILQVKYYRKTDLYILESTLSGKFTDGVKDINNKTKFGIQIRHFDDVIRNNRGKKIAIIKLKNKIELTDKLKYDLIKFYNRYKNSKFDYTGKTCLKPISPCISKNKILNNFIKTDNLFFCSEFVAEVYKVLNLIDGNIDSENIAPVNLVSLDIFHDIININDDTFLN